MLGRSESSKRFARKPLPDVTLRSVTKGNPTGPPRFPDATRWHHSNWRSIPDTEHSADSPNFSTLFRFWIWNRLIMKTGWTHTLKYWVNLILHFLLSNVWQGHVRRGGLYNALAALIGPVVMIRREMDLQGTKIKSNDCFRIIVGRGYLTCDQSFTFMIDHPQAVFYSLGL